jgi:hypothetical protein
MDLPGSHRYGIRHGPRLPPWAIALPPGVIIPQDQAQCKQSYNFRIVADAVHVVTAYMVTIGRDN